MRHDTAIRIGSGGMGEVFKAWDPGLERHVALKYLLHSNPELVERLLREARAQARIDHPSICKVYEVGEDDGRPFIAMQYVEGQQLAEAAETMTVEHKVLVIKKVAEAVQAAHAEGLIHRDLKPGNIMVGSTGNGELRPFVLDFGIAREQEVEGLTVSGQVLGTPGYVSPEQARGDSGSLDRRTDIFSLGVILYELLGGGKPFDGDSSAEMLVNLLENEPTQLRRRVPRVARDLETIVMTCLEKDRDHRYGSARALADDLGRFLDGEPIQARPRSWLSRLSIRVRKHPKTAALAVLSLLAILILTGVAVHSRWTAAQRERVAQRFGQEIERQESLLEHAYLLPLHDVRPAMEEVSQRIVWIDAEMAELGTSSQALGHFAAGRGHLALGETGRARERLEEAWRLGEQTPEVAYALGLSLAELYSEAVDEAAAIRNPAVREAHLARADEELRSPAIEFLRQSEGDAVAPSYLAAYLAFFDDDFDAALDHLARHRESAPYDYEGHLLAGVVHRRLFETCSSSGEEAAAEQAFASARQAFSEATVIGESDPRPYEQLCGLWVSALRTRYWSRGTDLPALRDSALESCAKALVANPDSVVAHLESGRSHRYWAAFEQHQGREAAQSIEASRHHARMALRADPENVDAHVLIGVTHRIAANLLADRGQDPRSELLAAVEAFREAIRIRPRDFGPYMSMANSLLYLGDSTRLGGGDPAPHFEAAAESAGRATELQPEIVGGWVNLGIAHAQLAISNRDTGKDPSQHFARGTDALERAIEINPNFFTAHFNLGELLLEQAVADLRNDQDPSERTRRARELLEASASEYPTWAAPHYLLAEGHALQAEFLRLSGEDPAGHLDRAREAIASGRAIRGSDATGLTRAALAHLVDARWRVDRDRSPGSALDAGNAMIDEALATNPNLAPAWLRRAELELLRAAWQAGRRTSPEATLVVAEEALTRAVEINPGDAAAHTAAAEMWRRRAEWLERRGESTTEAIEHGLAAAARALDIHPSRAEAIEQCRSLEMLGGRED